ncbi:MAG: bifunctional pyr operon transcriptional regulator/uracil phosphoribosyltransferase PyrR [Candidatus Omnitrophica bacterium]|nr:bifunctional pyr operon transcriptional regulator/uracil phosphoribosyltransferase PyrR [Candidatus Omnitrophota bacterium]
MGKKIMSGKEIDRIIRKSAGVIEKKMGLSGLVIIGIRRRGAFLADRLAECFSGDEAPVGYLDINLYRDDFSKIGAHPVLSETEVLFNIDGKKILLVDDVLFTGRTIRAALDALMDLGRPALVRLFVLVDRGHRELPISADFTGMKAETRVNEMVEVRLKEIDGVDEVSVEKRK